MKKFYLFTILFTTTLSIMAQQRSAKAISEIASKCSKYIGSQDMTLKVASSALLKNVKTDNEAFVVYAAGERPGFVIISADERMPEILAMSDNTTFDTQDGRNESLMELLNSYEAAHQLISEGKSTAEELFGMSADVASASSLTKEPLLGTISFNQVAPYNRKTPVINGKRSVTGCVPTGMAMVMKYFHYPEVGVGAKDYYTKTNNIHINYNFSNTHFDWGNILDSYPSYVNESKANITYNANRVFYFSSEGGFMFDESYPHEIRITNFYQSTGSTISGNLQLVVENADRTIKRVASEPKVVSNLQNNYGWSYYYIAPNLPADIPDGDYFLYLGFTTNNSVYTYAKEGSSGTRDYFVKVQKKGNMFTWNNHTFHCAVDVQEADAVATLMAACGAACEADYGENSTSAYYHIAMQGLHDYFGYDHDIYTLSTQDALKNDMIIETKKNLDANLIVPVSGHPEEGSGHFYLIDGYDMTGNEPMFHINWGWGGTSDGYFLLTYMQPSTAGTGGNESNYSFKFWMMYNVCPDNGKDDGNMLCGAEISSSLTTLSPNKKTTISVTSLQNNNMIKNLNGKVYLYLVDEEEDAYKCGAFATLNQLQPRWYYKSLSATITIPSNIPNGDYHLELRMSDNDRFYAIKNQTVTMTGSTSGIDIVAGGNSQGNMEYDLEGRIASQSYQGIRIVNGVKMIKK